MKILDNVPALEWLLRRTRRDRKGYFIPSASSYLHEIQMQKMRTQMFEDILNLERQAFERENAKLSERIAKAEAALKEARDYVYGALHEIDENENYWGNREVEELLDTIDAIIAPPSPEEKTATDIQRLRAKVEQLEAELAQKKTAT